MLPLSRNGQGQRRHRSFCIAVIACIAFGALALPLTQVAFAGSAVRQGRRLHAARAAQGPLPGLLGLADTESDEKKFEDKVDASFSQLSPQDLASLQLQLSQTEASSRKPLERLLQTIQKSMESRMEKATKEIEDLMQSSGNIDDNIRECMARQDSVLPIMAVLQMNIQRAQKAGNQQLEKALTYLYNTMNREIESKVPMVNRVLSRCLSTEDSDARRELLAAYYSEASGEEEAGKRPKSTAKAIVGLVSEAQAQSAQPGLDLNSALQRIRGVALDVGVVLGEVFDDKVQERFMEDIQPLFDALAAET